MDARRIFTIKIGDQEKLATKNLAKSKNRDKKTIIEKHGEEFLVWDPYDCKIAAAIRNGLQILPITQNSKVLYVGKKIKTTIHHLSNIANNGSVFVINDKNNFLSKSINAHENIITTSENRFKQSYSESLARNIDVLYIDIEELDETELIFKKYLSFLKIGGFLIITIKKDEHRIFEENTSKWLAEQKSGLNKARELTKKLEHEFEIIQQINLGLNYSMKKPFHKSHIFILAQYSQNKK